MKTMYFTGLLALILLAAPASAQLDGVGVGANTPDRSAALDVQHSSKGMLVPRMTKQQRNAIATPANGLMIYQTDSSAGFYVNKGTTSAPKWKPVNSPAQAFKAYLKTAQTFPGSTRIVGYTTVVPPAGETLLHEGEIFMDSAIAFFTAPEEGLYYLEAGISWNTELLTNNNFHFSTYPNNIILPAQNFIDYDPIGNSTYNKVYMTYWFKKGDKCRVYFYKNATINPGRTNYFRAQKID